MGGLAAEGIAKAAGDRNITYGDLLTAAVGIIPGGGDAEDAAEGLNLASHAPEEGETLFRGTSEGFTGSPGLRAVGVTPATTDPVVGAIFATHAEQFGPGVLHIASPADLAGVKILPGNVLSGLEREVAAEITLAEFAARAGTDYLLGQRPLDTGRHGVRHSRLHRDAGRRSGGAGEYWAHVRGRDRRVHRAGRRVIQDVEGNQVPGHRRAGQ